MPMAPALPPEIWSQIARQLGLRDTAILMGATFSHVMTEQDH